jgi:thiol-disulfide isomerase/thioredoxin
LRNKPLVIGVVAVAVIAGAYFARRGHRAPAPLRVTQVDHPLAPAFALPDLNGQQIELSKYQGKVVLVDFWATWCTPCREEIPRFVEWQKQYGDQGLQVIGISMDDGQEPVREFYKKFNLNYPVVMGNDKVAEAYGGVLGLPINFLVGKDGRIIKKYVGMTDLPALEREIQSELQSGNGAPGSRS